MVFGGLQRPILMDVKNYHIATVTSMVLSPCGKFIVTTGEDCVLLVFKLQLEVDGLIQE